MIQLHYYPSTAAMAPHILIEELGVPYELKLVDRTKNAHKAPEYLKLNPNGLIPVLVDGDLVLYESAAICLHLCDTHAESGLAPPNPGSHERAHFYKWLFWLSNTLQATSQMYWYPERFAGEPGAVAEVKQKAEARIGTQLELIDAELAGHGKEWLLGDTYSAADAYALMLCRWTRYFKRPARALPRLGPYLQRVLARPAVRRAFEQEGIAEPWV